MYLALLDTTSVTANGDHVFGAYLYGWRENDSVEHSLDVGILHAVLCS